MIAHLRHHLVAYLALFIALGGTSYAATRLPADSVGSEQVVNGSLQYQDFQRGGLSDGVFKQPGNLPELGSGKTLRGNYSLGGPGTGGPDYATDSISFVFTLKSAPEPHYVKHGQTPPPECKGSLSLPKADPGHLCLYEAEPSGTVNNQSVGDPVSGNVAAANRFGAIVNAWAEENYVFAVSGTWAVTSP
jgi:hypothetical protein